MSASTSARRARRGGRAVRQAASSSAMDAAARWGLGARGVIYVLVGLLALQIAFGGGGQADQTGAVREVAKEPFGAVVVWAIGLGLVGMALWRLSEALFGASGRDGDRASKRAVSGVRFAIYTFLAFSVLKVAVGSGGSSSNQQSQDFTARALELPAGRWLVGLAGVVVLATGLYIAVQGLRKTFREELKLGQMSRRQRKIVEFLGLVGSVCRGTVFAAAGIFVLQAALAADADQAKGLDQTLRSFADTPAGPWLLAAIALGLALFGAFSLALARWRKV
ncbi:DUF1206 domain-containing protein [Streptomyces sp. JJ66]|uniref:DUF1206 domain-containing protein n=1 Tax=Streptomyces sp. JJ66 TaxID=2803843 RepID=UPI001C5955D3|nr:DUF1206 domain-containing protein [Streptomyces sp. JJ66]MBW1604122.1 DUF1206 domain-containing protein [Streptomyces sp. JJ66]